MTECQVRQITAFSYHIFAVKLVKKLFEIKSRNFIFRFSKNNLYLQLNFDGI